MITKIYRLRHKGERLSREVVLERGPITGRLLYRERVTGSGIYLATLVIDTDGTYGLPPLDRAALRRITPTGLMIFGKEVHTRIPSIKSSTEYFSQVWWCVPCGVDLAPQLRAPAAMERTLPAWQRATSS